MAEFVGAIDQGTTSTRFMIFDHAGNEVSKHQLEHEQIMPRPGWVLPANPVLRVAEARRGTHSRRLARRRRRRYPLCPRPVSLGGSVSAAFSPQSRSLGSTRLSEPEGSNIAPIV